MASRASIKKDVSGERQERGFRTRPHVPGPPGKAQLCLLAVVHGDPAGFSRAWRFFDHWRPEVITVEISRFSVRYRERAARDWRRRLAAALKALPPAAAASLAVARVAAQAEVPFEYRVAREWGQSHHAAVKLLDSGALARHHLPRYATELLTAANLRHLGENGSAGSLEDFVAGEFRRARRALQGRLGMLPRCADTPENRREGLWAKRLQRLAAGGKRVAHLGGWEHLVPRPDGDNLLGLLSDLNPEVILLDEADQL
jgi:hypothetical protein